MRTLCALFTVILASSVLADTYKVSQLKYENFKAYDQYGISTETIRAVLIAFSKENPSFDQSGLFQLAAKLADIYRAEGLVFHRVEVIRGNPTRLVLVPGVMSAIDVRGNRRYTTEQLSPFFDDMFGRLVDNTSLSEAMTRMNSLPGLQALSFLSFGANPGDAVLNVNVNQESWGQLTTRLNNQGTNATGEYRLASQVTLNNPLKLSEQWRLGGSVSDSTENWSASIAVDFHQRGKRVIGLSGQYQNMALTEDFDLLNMSGWQATGQALISATPIQSFAKTFRWKANVGYLQQALTNDANISFFDITIQDIPAHIGIAGDFSGNKTFLGYEIEAKAGYLLDYQGTVTLEDDYWSHVNAELSFAQSLTGGVLQRGIDFKNKLQLQYAINDLPSHRRFGLSGPSKLAAYGNGVYTADTAAFNETSLSLLNLRLGWFQTVLNGVGQAGYGITAGSETDLLLSVGATLDVNLGPLTSRVSYFTNEEFADPKLWFEVTLNWPTGK